MTDILKLASGEEKENDGLPRGDDDTQIAKMIEWADEFDQHMQRALDRSDKARDFYDGKQWTTEELIALDARGQPPTVMNRIFPRVNDTLGAEDENKTDPRAYPRTFDAHNDESEAATDSLRAWDDIQKYNDKMLRVLENLAVEGYGAVVFQLGREVDPGPDGKLDLNVINLVGVPRERLFWDPHSQEPDFSDALYKGMVTWMHYSEALARWPDHAEILDASRNSANDTSTDNTLEDRPRWFHTTLQRVAVREVWYHETDKDGKKIWMGAKYVRGGFLEEPEKVVWVDDKGDTYCPLRMVSGFVNRDNERYGMVFNMISPQEEVNKRRSKALHHFVSNAFMYEEHAIPQVQTFKQEASKPDGALMVADGVLKEGGVEFLSMSDRGQAHLALEQEAKAEIDELGPHANLPAGAPQDLSARSFFAQQQAGMRKIGPLFKNYRAFKLDVYRHAWYGIRKFWPEERWIRVRDKSDSNGYRFVQINQSMTRGERLTELAKRGAQPEDAVRQSMGQEGLELLVKLQTEIQQAQQIGQQNGFEVNMQEAQVDMIKKLLASPKAKEKFKVNDISRLDVDILIDVTPKSTILEHEQFTMLSEMKRNGVDIPMETIIKASMLHNKGEVLEAMKKQQEAGAQAQQQQQQLQMQALQAQVEKMMADAKAAMAKAEQLMADAAKKRAEVEIEIPAEADRDEAQSAKLVSEAQKNASEARAIPEKLDIERAKIRAQEKAAAAKPQGGNSGK
jgi:hypothetical protein